MRWLALLLALSGCSPASVTAIGSAALNTSLAVGVAAAQRAQGGCYATCTHGLVCNPTTGRCEERPCANGCGSGQFCDNGAGHIPMCRELPPPSSSSSSVPASSTTATPTTAPPASPPTSAVP